MSTKIVLLVGLFLSAANAQAWDQLQYNVTDLGPVVANAINNSGQVTGSISNSPGSGYQYAHAFIWQSSTGLQDLGVIAGQPIQAPGEGNAINSSGQIVGWSDNTAFLYSGGVMQNLNGLIAAPGWKLVTATGVNDSGQIVGQATSLASGQSEDFIASTGTMQLLGSFTGYTINNAGQILGDSSIYSNGAIQSLGSFMASAINNSGQVSGFTINSSGYYQASIYNDGTILPLGTVDDQVDVNSEALAINNVGQAVGLSQLRGDTGISEVAFLYSNDYMQNLNTLIDPTSGWTLQEATGINDSGEIIGQGINPSGQTDAFLLTPTPEPGTLALLGASAVVVLGCAWRRRVKRRLVKEATYERVQDGDPSILAFPSTTIHRAKAA